MPSTYTNNLRLTKQADGDNLNTWGQILNNGVFELLEDSISTFLTINVTAFSTYNLTTANGSTDEARALGIIFTGNPLGPVTITIPVASKAYVIRNESTQNIIISTGNPTTRTVPPGLTDLVFTQGTAVFSLLASAVAINAPVPVSQGGTGVTTLSALLTNLLPSQTGNAGRFLRTNGTTPSWESVPDSVPVGSILAFAYSGDPTNYMSLNGRAISRTTYSALFAAIGTYYGAGDGSTTFNIPDYRGYVLAGLDPSGAAGRLTAAASGVNGALLGATGGSQTHTLTEAQLPAHSHGVTYSQGTSGVSGQTIDANVIPYLTGPQVPLTAWSTSSVGGGQAHNNTQPTIITNFCIKVL